MAQRTTNSMSPDSTVSSSHNGSNALTSPHRAASTESESKTTSRRRACGTRVKSGCITCKIRRVKCDEGKPSCRRCTSTGRVCDGYISADQRSHLMKSRTRITPPYRTSLATLGGDTRKLGVIHLFCHRTARRMSENFEDDYFWKTTVPKLAHSEPAVWNALLAVNTVFEQVELNAGFSVFENNPLAIQSYNTAIRHLLQRDPVSDSDVYVALVTCVLFVCLESMRGDMSVALRHIKYGFQVLKNRDARKLSSNVTRTPATQDQMSDLSAVLERLRVQTILFDPLLLHPPQPNPATNLDDFVNPSIFSSLSEARNQFLDLSTEAMDVIISAQRLKFAGEIPFECIVRQIRIESLLQTWLVSLEALIATSQESWSWQQSKAANILMMQGLCLVTWVPNCLQPDQSGFDDFHSNYERIIELALQTVGHGMVSNFQFDLGVIASLHFVGVKCRYPDLRRQVLKILGAGHWREGLFDSHRTYRCVHMVMEAEEKEVGPDGLSTENARIHGGRLELLTPGASKQRHDLISKPNGEVLVEHRWIETSGDLPTFEPWPVFNNLENLGDLVF